MTHNVIIIGSGPAGLTAGVYTGRASLKPIIISGSLPGGQLMTTTTVENWPGDSSVMGPELMMRMRKHAETYGAQFIDDVVNSVDFSKTPYQLTTHSGETFQTKSIIIASGANHKKLNVPGEQEYWGHGVTTCATCDGPFYQNRRVVIAGGGNTAVTEASFLTRFASHITIIQNLPELSANDPIKFSVLNNPKVSILYSHTITEIKGRDGMLSAVVATQHNGSKTTTIETDGLFIAIGFKPNTDLFKGQLAMDTAGYLSLTEHTQTSKPGIFAAGDVADFTYMQAITAAGMGCMAALDCERFLRSQPA